MRAFENGETDTISAYEGPRLQRNAKKDTFPAPNVSIENIESEPEEKNDEVNVKSKEANFHENNRMVTFFSPEGVMPLLNLNFSSAFNTNHVQTFGEKKASPTSASREPKSIFKRNVFRKHTKSHPETSIMKNLMLKQKLLRFVDNLRINSGVRSIKKCSVNILKIINDLSYEHKKDWNFHEESSDNFAGIDRVRGELNSFFIFSGFFLQRLARVFIFLGTNTLFFF